MASKVEAKKESWRRLDAWDKAGQPAIEDGRAYDSMAASVLGGKPGLSVNDAKSLDGLADRCRIMEAAIAAMEAAPNDYNLRGIPGTNPCSIRDTFGVGVGKVANAAATATIEAVLGV